MMGEKEIHTMSNKKTYVKRTIIKLGNSYAITFPLEFLDSFADTSSELKGLNIHCYKSDDFNILIKKNTEGTETHKLNVSTSEFPINLLETLFRICRKLNIPKVVLNYEEIDYENILDIFNKLRLNPIHSSGNFIMDLSRDYRKFNFPEQLNNIIKNIDKIIQLIFQEKQDVSSKKSVDIYLQAIKSSYDESVSVLIYYLTYYKILNQITEEDFTGVKDILNILGNRVLLLNLHEITQSIKILFHYRNYPEIEKFEIIITKIPKILQWCIDLSLSEEVTTKIDDINQFKKYIEEIEKYSQNIKQSVSFINVNEAIIRNKISIIIDIFNDIFEIVLSRWIESKITVG